MQQSIDIVIPSFRLNEEILIGIFSLKKPKSCLVKYFLIADNPSVVISEKLSQNITENNVTLLVNSINLGFSRTRNKGIDAGNGDWIVLLDDDIIPQPDLLIVYSNAIEEYPDSIGFAGATKFPKPFNIVTEALFLNGSVGHFDSTIKGKEISWTPTANVLLNRKKLADRRFLPELKNGGEDIELLFRNSVENSQKYISIPEAYVTHPWWNEGRSQIKRMFRYGKGISDIIDLPHHRSYTYLDFTTTIESTLLILFFAIATYFIDGSFPVLLVLLTFILLAEFLTNLIRSIKLSGRFSLNLAVQMLLHKNSYEAGALFRILEKRKFNYIFKRLDVSFTKPNPSAFRLNKWKIIKLSLIVIMTGIYYFIKAN